MLRLYVSEIVHPTEGVYKSSSRIGLQEKVRSLYNKLNTYLNRILNEDSCSGLIFSQSYRNGLKVLTVTKLVSLQVRGQAASCEAAPRNLVLGGAHRKGRVGDHCPLGSGRGWR